MMTVEIRYFRRWTPIRRDDGKDKSESGRKEPAPSTSLGRGSSHRNDSMPLHPPYSRGTVHGILEGLEAFGSCRWELSIKQLAEFLEAITTSSLSLSSYQQHWKVHSNTCSSHHSKYYIELHPPLYGRELKRPSLNYEGFEMS